MLTDTERRPCHQHGQDPNACAMNHYRRVIDNHVTLHGPWAGWRLAGRDLVSPDKQRISPERLRGLLFRDAAERRIAAAKRQEKKRTVCPAPVVIPARERFAGCA